MSERTKPGVFKKYDYEVQRVDASKTDEEKSWEMRMEFVRDELLEFARDVEALGKISFKDRKEFWRNQIRKYFARQVREKIHEILKKAMKIRYTSPLE